MAPELARFRGGALAALLCILGLAAWWTLRAADGGAPRAPTEPAATGTAAAEVRLGAQLSAAEPGASLAPAERGPERVALAPEIAVEGTVVVLDASGAEHCAESGSMELRGSAGDAGIEDAVDAFLFERALQAYRLEIDGRLMGEPGTGWKPQGLLRVEVSAGRWTATVPRGTKLTFESIVLGGRRTIPLRADRVAVPESGRVEVKMRWPEPNTLRVRLALTHADLAGVDLMLDSNAPFNLSQHPGAYKRDDALVSGASSPLDLDALAAQARVRGQMTFFARAQGFAWKGVLVDLEAGGERVIELEPAGDLHITLAGEIPSGVSLRVRSASGSGLELDEKLKGRLRERQREVTSLPPGSYNVSVELGDWFQNPYALGSTSAEVVAGTVAFATVEIKTPETSFARLAGTLVVDPGWGEVSPSLHVESRDTPYDGRPVELKLGTAELQRSPEAANTWTFDAGLVPHGAYQLEVEPPLYQAIFQLDAGAGDLRLLVPAPASVSLRPVDEQGREVAQLSSLDWRPAPPPGWRGGGMRSIERARATGRFEILAPAGRIHVSVTESDCEAQASFDLAPGPHALDLVVRRMVGFTLVLRDGQATVPWNMEWKEGPHQVDGVGALSGISMSMQQGTIGTGGASMRVTELKVRVTQPGRYRFSLPDIDGFEPLPEQEVVVPEGGFVEHAVDLVRAR